MVKAWFDTTNAGPKQESGSYTTIATELKTKPQRILFLSDNVSEIRAALQADMHAIVVDRPGNAPLSDADKHELGVVESFDQLQL